MARHSVSEPRVEALIDRLSDLVLKFGTVNAVAQALGKSLGGGAGNGVIYPNRLHGLLADDINRGINTGTLELLERASDALGPDALPVLSAFDRDQLRAELVSEVAEHGTDEGVRRLAQKLDLPIAVVRRLHEAPEVVPTTAPPKTTVQTPDWSWQDVAVDRCLHALKKGGQRKVGLVVPTAGGKTRIALRVALDWLANRENNEVVVWVTHRLQLRKQARRTLQALIREQGLPPEEATAAFERVKFEMVTTIEEKMASLAPSLVIVDEAHHAAAPSYAALVALPVPGLFLTATPNRADGLPIGINEIAYTITYRGLFARGCVVEPVFAPPEDMPGLDWNNPVGLRDLADYLLERTETDFAKPLVVVSTRERAEILHASVLEQLDERQSHPLTAEDVGYVHGGSNSRGLADAGDFLDEFKARPAGILISTGQLVGEGFDDPNLDAAVVTYESTSIGHLMQVAGRALRVAPGKVTAHVVQVRESHLQYHFDQRWLYQDISDALRPELVDRTYISAADLQSQVAQLMEAHGISAPVAERIKRQLSGEDTSKGVTLMLTGLPYYGDAAYFAADARWGAILVPSSERKRFIDVFNDVSARTADIKEPHLYLSKAVPRETAAGSLWKSYIDLLSAMEFARREIKDIPTAGGIGRGYVPGRATTWLKYVTFVFQPTVRSDLDALLADAFNRDQLIEAYLADPSQWHSAVRLELPGYGSEGFLLGGEPGIWLVEQRSQLLEALTQADRSEAFGTVEEWRRKLSNVPLPLRVIENIAQLLRPERVAQHLLVLVEDGTPESGR